MRELDGIFTISRFHTAFSGAPDALSSQLNTTALSSPPVNSTLLSNGMRLLYPSEPSAAGR